MIPSAKRPKATRIIVSQTRAGVPYGTAVALWNRSFQKLKEFYRQHGHFNIPAEGAHANIYQWANQQRVLKRYHRLRPERQRRLERVGFNWDYRSLKLEQAWELKLAELVRFHQVHGHFNVPKHGDTILLYNWFSRQNHDQRVGLLRADRQQRLEAAGVCWLKAPARMELTWNRYFDQLVEFYRANGHFKVPSLGRKSGLHEWIIRQRLLKRCQRLRPDRQERLTMAGFDWGYSRRYECAKGLG